MFGFDFTQMEALGKQLTDFMADSKAQLDRIEAKIDGAKMPAPEPEQEKP